MARNSVSIRMSNELRRNLNNLPNDIKRIVKGAMIEVAIVKIETVAKQTLTREGHVDTGRLRSSIHTRYGNVNTAYNYRDKNGNIYDGTFKLAPIDDMYRFQVWVGTNVEYAGYIERRFPYLIPAFVSSKEHLVRKIRSKMRRY